MDKIITDEEGQFLKTIDLFKGLSSQQIEEFLKKVEAKVVTLAASQQLFREKDPSDNVYILLEGKVEVRKAEGSSQHLVATLFPGATIGDLALIDYEPRSASIISIITSKFVSFSIIKFHELQQGEMGFFSILKSAKYKNMHNTIIHNAAKRLSSHVRLTTLSVAEGLRKQNAMSNVIIVTIIIMCTYAFILKFIQVWGAPMSSTMIGVPIMFAFLWPDIYIMKTSGFPMSTYGFTLKNWDKVIIEAIIWTLPLMVGIFIYKLILIHLPGHEYRSLFEMSLNAKLPIDTGLAMKIGLVSLYILFVPIQEIMTRGALQTSLQVFLTGRFRYFWAILTSNLIFSSFHLHLSLMAGVSAFTVGLYWGILYYKQGSLIGVITSHLLLGIWAFFFMNIL